MSVLEDKLNGTVNEFQETENQIAQVEATREQLITRREQLRGKVVAFQELIDEERAEVVDAVPVEADEDDSPE